MAARGAPTTIEELRRRAQDDGIEFFFAQFVDMHGKPNAKLVPIENFDSMMEEGAGFAGFAAGPMGQTPASPTCRHARPVVVHEGAVQAGPGAVWPATSPSRASRGRTVRARSWSTR